MNVLNLGEQTAVGLGANVNKEQFKLLAAAVGLAASSVAVSGGIGFVGLVGPHLARRLVGPKHQLMLPASALLGALLVITADTIGRWILQPSEIPTGIVVAVIGAPYFCICWHVRSHRQLGQHLTGGDNMSDQELELYDVTIIGGDLPGCIQLFTAG